VVGELQRDRVAALNGLCGGQPESPPPKPEPLRYHHPVSSLRQNRWVRLAAALVGLVLVVAAIGYILRANVLGELTLADLPGLAWIGAVILGNLAVTSLLLWLITRSFPADPPVRFARMVELICASALLNFLPLRTGFVGRAAYLKWQHQFALRDSVKVILTSTLLGAIVVIITTIAMLIAPGLAGWTAAAGGVAALSVASEQLARRFPQGEHTTGAAWPWLRVIDLVLGAVRLWIAFGLLGVALPFEQAVILAGAGLLVTLVGVTPNGLGMTEWLIAALTAALTPEAAAVGAAAKVIDRAAEAIVACVTGSIGLVRLRPSVGLP